MSIKLILLVVQIFPSDFSYQILYIPNNVLLFQSYYQGYCSIMILFGALCLVNTSLIQILTISSTNTSSVQGIKYPYLVNLSIMTNTISYIYPITRSVDFSSLIIKSYIITFYGLLSVLTGYSSPYSLYLLNLFLWQFRHSLVTSLTRFYMFLIVYSYYSLITNAIALL